MNIARVLTEITPSIRWRAGAITSRLLYRRAFAAFGEGSVIVSPLKILGTENIRVGDNVAVYEGAWLAAEQGGRLTIGSKTYIGHRAHLHAFADVTIGDECVLADNVLINSAAHVPFAIQEVRSAGTISIGNRVFIGQNVSILGGVTIGDDAIIGAGAVVTRNVPPGSVVAGVPARELR